MNVEPNSFAWDEELVNKNVNLFWYILHDTREDVYTMLNRNVDVEMIPSVYQQIPWSCQEICVQFLVPV